jgi:hypothetical protein
MPATTYPSRRLATWFLVGVLVLTLGVSMGGTMPVVAQNQPRTTVGRVTLVAEPGSGIDIDQIAAAHGDTITTAWPQLTALFGTEPSLPLTITFVNATNPEMLAGLRWVTDEAWVSPNGATAVIVAGPFLALTPIEAGNVLRNVTSRGFIHDASGGNIPPGLMDGIARYIETPVVARQARLGSLVQGLDQAGTVPGWDPIMRGAVPGLSQEVRTATAYAVTAFLVDRYGVAQLRGFVRGFADTPDWGENATIVYGQAASDLESAWAQFLPRWFASGWRENAVSAFDLSRAEALFARGAYEAAAAEAERSQRLFLDLDDQVGLSQVETLLALCAIGLQADSIMTETQAALESHDYETALLLLGNAEDLYALLPEEHRPGGIIDEYRRLAETGLAANADLAEANRLQNDWLQVTTARDQAIAAGNGYAYLGNGDGRAAAEAVVDGIDTRIRRMVFVLSALVVALAAWLATWTWLHAPGRLHWPAREAVQRPWGASEGGD